MIVALVHDILITVGIYALLGREVTTATVAAVLTVLGYSIYDTIIIFDRIRENIPLMKRGSFRQITNVSLWETIPRSLATTFITLLPIVSLLVFGGETLKDFAFALLDRHRVRCLLVDLHRGAAARLDQGARARVRAPQGREPARCSRSAEPLLVEGSADAGRGGCRADRSASPQPAPVAAPAPGELVEPRAPARPPLDAAARPRAVGGDSRRRGRRLRRMDENGSTDGARSFEQLLLAGLGWLSLTAEAADELADDLARRVGVEPRRDARRRARRVRELAQGRGERARRDAGGRAPRRRSARLGLVRREEVDDLALRLAQLEHRVRLLEKPAQD